MGVIKFLLRPSQMEFHHHSFEILEKRKESELAECQRQIGCEVRGGCELWWAPD